jgi:DNA-directed RNA polymerase subunit L
MATFEVTKKAEFTVKTEFRNFPLTFVNGIRRIALSSIPIVVLRGVQIDENTSQMPHEMLKHRVELLPVNVLPTETEIIKNARVKLVKSGEAEVTTDDFESIDGRDGLLMRDRDLKTPLLFIRLKANETVRLVANLALEKGSQVCTCAMSYHIDPERASHDRKLWVEKGEDPRIFDNFYIQKSYSIDDIGRPNWIDLSIETVGVLSPSQILTYAIQELKMQVDTWMTEALQHVTKESDGYAVKIDGSHTLGALFQEIIYHAGISFVSYDIPHPMRSKMILKFVTDSQPEKILKDTQKSIHDYCEIIEKGL